jgi:hypothetical protein
MRLNDNGSVSVVLKQDNLRPWDKTQGCHARQHPPATDDPDDDAFLSGA